jgi:hypothetical protein
MCYWTSLLLKSKPKTSILQLYCTVWLRSESTCRAIGFRIHGLSSDIGHFTHYQSPFLIIPYFQVTLESDVGLPGTPQIPTYDFLFPFWLPLEHGASTKLTVSLQFLNLGQSVGQLNEWSARRKTSTTSTYTGQHTHRINVHIHINIHSSSRILTFHPVIQASQDSSCLRPLGYRDRPVMNYYTRIVFRR